MQVLWHDEQVFRHDVQVFRHDVQVFRHDILVFYETRKIWRELKLLLCLYLIYSSLKTYFCKTKKTVR